ncbi:histidine--tRNA ligase [Paenibacillus sp. YN15]|uniref:histidine--tRNA ligase n=1 Tax=Paenibacillus sp. YN15 TaxID=1742774 RepID=UPI000DCBC123|nr:histidine--tRNA ligase [Paenibacillus sp. YN15]RAV01747.1 histidine--tRNA ligase [Paenibacillus sp. YN15]
MQNVKGTADYVGSVEQLRGQVREWLTELFRIYDFAPMETTVLNEMELLEAKYGGGEEILKEVYALSDQGGRSLGLRYDLTLPFAKVLALQPGLPLPIRRYEMGKVFRDGPVKKGRLREFTQCDADIAGIAGPMAELELFGLARDVFERVNLPVRIHWNNRRLLQELLEALQVPMEDMPGVMLVMDKLHKIGTGGVRQELLQKGLDEGTVERLLKLSEASEWTPHKLTAAFGLKASPGAEEALALLELLEEAGLASICRFEPFLTRGLSFYTGTVFEVFDATGKYPSSLAAGGRYDAMAGKLGGNPERDCPAVGISFGLESMMALLHEGDAGLEVPAAIVLPIGDEALPAAARAADGLRQSGICTRVEYSGRKLAKALSSVAKSGIRYAVLVGPEEAASNHVRLKDLTDRSEMVMPLDQAVYMIEKTTDQRLFAW